ncbi:MAG: rod shape-determining protein RodA [Bdellovibrionota bacterium]|jgi:rod shape determining protein RodA
MNPSPSSQNRIFNHFDWSFLGLVLGISALGLMTLYSSTYLNRIDIFYKQSLFLGMGLVIAMVIGLIDYRIFERLAWPAYVGVILLLIAVDLFGKTSQGSQRWLGLGPIHIQPSELAKFAVILVLAQIYSSHKSAPIGGYRLKHLLPIFGIIAVPILLVFLQPDLGTAIMIGLVAASIIFFCQIRMRTLVALFAIVVVSVPIAYHFVLKEYQRDRVRTFLDPQRDPLGEGYHSIQSMIAVGSGQVFGKGFLQGTQSKLEFLPKHHTDFIFSAFAEEWGFVGATVVMGLFVLLTLLGVDIARKAKDQFGAILAVGATSLIIWHVIINVGMEIGVLPVVGVTLPFFSYGGSSMITNMLAVGILLSVSFRRHVF